MAVLGINDFKSKLKSGGARPNLFQVIGAFPGYAGGSVEELSFLCKAAQLPGSQYGEIIVPFRGRQVKLPGDRTFDQWSITVINDNNMGIRDAFERWMNAVNEHERNTGLSAPDDYGVDFLVQQLNKQGEIVKSYSMKDAFPLNIGPIEVSYDQTDSIEEFQVTLDFQYWMSNTTS